jgi:hypothetical protein
MVAPLQIPMQSAGPPMSGPLGGTMPPSMSQSMPVPGPVGRRPRQAAHPLWLLVALLVVALIALGVWALTEMARHGSAGTPGVPTPTHLAQSANMTMVQLRKLGLRPSLVANFAGTPVGSVPAHRECDTHQA